MDFDSLIEAGSKQFHLDIHWMKAIITQESRWNACAMRYESSYPYFYKPESFTHSLNSLRTELVSQRMSWGLSQIMGGLARELGHKGFMSELVQPELNIHYLGTRLTQLVKISPKEEDVFAMYNGGPGAIKKLAGKFPNQSYVDSVMSHLQNLKA